MVGAAFHWMGSWHGPLHVVWNSLAILLELLYVVVVVRIPAERFPHGRRSKVWWIVAGLVQPVYVPGLVLPIGALVAWPLVVARVRRANRTGDAGTDASGYSFYPDRS